MKKLLRFLVAVILSMTLYLCLMPSAHAVSTSGTWGSLNWSLNDSGVLTISGSGAMKDFTGNIQMPDAYTIIYDGWQDPKIKNQVTSVVIQSGITSIGFLAFSDCPKLVNITIPASIQTIQGLAFSNSTALRNIYYSGTQQQFGEIIMYAYGNESFLSASVHYNSTGPAATYTVTYNAYGGSGAPASQTKTQGQALTLSSITPTCANSTSEYTVTLDANGGSVSQNALTAARTTSYTFLNWNTAANGSGTSYYPGDTYTADANVTLYAQWFSSTTTAAVTLPTPTRSGYTFKGWSTSSSASSGFTGSYTPSGNVTLYAAWASSGDSIASGKWGNLNWTLMKNGLLTISGSGEMDEFPYDDSCAWLSYTGRIVKLAISEGVTSIGNNAFRNCSGLTIATIPSSVTSIGYRAFIGCSSLTSVTIPSSVTSIGSLAFAGCSSLTSVTIPPSLTSIDYGTFASSGLTSVTIPSSVTSIGVSAFAGCEGLTSVTIPSSVTSIGRLAFRESTRLTSVTIPSSVTSIGEYAFDSCSSLKIVFYGGSQKQWSSINIGNDNDPLQNATIHYNSFSPDFVLPSYLTTIGSEAFAGGAFSGVKLPDKAVSIGSRAFANCPYLTYIYIPALTTDIAWDAFSGVSSLTIFGKSGSTAESYAQSHGFTFVGQS